MKTTTKHILRRLLLAYPLVLVGVWFVINPASPRSLDLGDPQQLGEWIDAERATFARPGGLRVNAVNQAGVPVPFSSQLARAALSSVVTETVACIPRLNDYDRATESAFSPTIAYYLFLVARPGSLEIEVDGLSPPEAECLGPVLQTLPLAGLVPADTTLVVAGPVHAGSIVSFGSARSPMPPAMNIGYSGTFWHSTTTPWQRLRGSRSTVGGDPIFYRLDESGIRTVNVLLSCPSEVPATTLEAEFRPTTIGLAEAGLVVSLDPPVPCVEERVRQHWDELERVISANGHVVGIEGDPDSWPERPTRIGEVREPGDALQIELSLVLPVVAR